MTHTVIKLMKASVFMVAYVFFASVVMAKGGKYDAFQVKVTGKGQPIILIPGATCSGDEWNETVAHLSGKYQCHVFTIAGYAGTAPMAKGPYLETIRKELEQYIEDQKLEHVILIGHSIGGFLSLCMASEMKDHLQKSAGCRRSSFLRRYVQPKCSRYVQRETGGIYACHLHQDGR
jgi:pimeloyl-ACP methyl ester carboxylesterase